MTFPLPPLALTVRPVSAILAAGCTFSGLVVSYYYTHGDRSSGRFQPKFARNAESEERLRELRYRRRHMVFAIGVVWSLGMGLAILLISQP